LAAVGATSGLTAAITFTLTAEAVPYLDQGVAGCNRVAFIFNVGIGQPLDTGVLETLAANTVPATMFLSGWWAAAFPDMARRLRDGGYVIGSHGDGRGVLPALSDAGVAADVQLAHQEIATALGEPPAPWLTPYAAAIDARVREIVWRQGYTPVGWRVSAGDWRVDATESAVYANVVNRVYDGAIVEFHLDGVATPQSTGRALPRIIATLRERGYRFVTIPEMAQPCVAEPEGKTIATAVARRSSAVHRRRSAVGHGSGAPATPRSIRVMCHRPRLAVKRSVPRKAQLVGWHNVWASGSSISRSSLPRGSTRKRRDGS
jgi:peptidoglycan/xylan/chitin deacetylase (PgdA/CDA1 family)